MKWRSLATCLACATLINCAGHSPLKLHPVDMFVGTDPPPLPPGSDYGDGFITLGGFMLDDVWGLGRIQRGSETVLLLQRLLRHDDEGRPFFRIEKAALAPKVPRGYELWFYTCSTTANWDPAILAVVRLEEKQLLDTVLAAWRVDAATQQFVPMSAVGIKCEDETFGE